MIKLLRKKIIKSLFFQQKLKKEGRLPRAAPHLDVSEAWSLTSLRFSYKWALSLFGGSSRGAQLLVYRWMVVRRGGTSSAATERWASGGTHMDR